MEDLFGGYHGAAGAEQHLEDGEFLGVERQAAACLAATRLDGSSVMSPLRSSGGRHVPGRRASARTRATNSAKSQGLAR